MGKKTWIKIKRGILEPKHIEKLGQAWYLYFYILDQADWGTGTIKEWKDEFAAIDLEKPIGLIREHRKHLAAEKYIICEKNQHSQTITIHNWTDPRRYDKHLLNPEPESMEKDECCDDEIFESSGQSEGQSVLEAGIFSVPSYNHMLTGTQEFKTPIQKFVSISGVSWYPKNLDGANSWNKTLEFLSRAGITDEIIAQACDDMRASGKEVTDPESIIPACSAIMNSLCVFSGASATLDRGERDV